MQKLKVLLIVLCILLLRIPVARPEVSYVILADVVSSSGWEAESESYLLRGSTAQPVIGMSCDGRYIESAGFWHWNMSWPEPVVGVRAEPSLDQTLPKEFGLSQNYPNPFNPVTNINYALPEVVYVRLQIYNILGQRVITLVDEPQTAGYKRVSWNGRDEYGREMASGVYFCGLEAGRYAASKKLLLLK